MRRLRIARAACGLAALSFPVLASASVPSQDAKAQFGKWAAIKNVYPGPAEPIGGYDAGCLSGATRLDTDGEGYAIMRLSRNRYYSHPEMNTYLHALGEKLKDMKMPLLLVGDVSPPRGGPMLRGHASHQIGLDADIWLTMGRKRPTKAQRESWGASSFVIKRKKLRRNWSDTQVNLIEAAASFDSVGRIFVSPAIKRYFCEHRPEAAWLYKLRSWWGHEEHIHVRLNCPPGAAGCVAQTPLDPANNGCGSELEWWFSQEADEKWAEMKRDSSPREFPTLPGECAKMVESGQLTL